jgi:hypothetical protein
LKRQETIRLGVVCDILWRKIHALPIATALYAPEVECANKSKAHALRVWRHGVHLMMLKDGSVLGAFNAGQCLRCVHTAEALKQAVVLWGIDPAIVFIHPGQKDVEIDQMQICCSGQRRVVA